MKTSMYTGGYVMTNAYLLETSQGNILIDAPQGVTDWLAKQGTRVDAVLLTHQHYDHVEDAAKLQLAGAKIYAHSAYSKELTLESPAKDRGFPVSVIPYQIDSFLNTEEAFSLFGEEIQLSYLPGHSPDSVTFYFAKYNMVFSGDTLFEGSIGRSDLPGGDGELLIKGILENLMRLPVATQVYPGHGDPTTIADEKAMNPFL